MYSMLHFSKVLRVLITGAWQQGQEDNPKLEADIATAATPGQPVYYAAWEALTPAAAEAFPDVMARIGWRPLYIEALAAEPSRLFCRFWFQANDDCLRMEDLRIPMEVLMPASKFGRTNVVTIRNPRYALDIETPRFWDVLHAVKRNSGDETFADRMSPWDYMLACLASFLSNDLPPVD